MTTATCQAAPTITRIGDFLLIECAACGDSWTTPALGTDETAAAK